MTRLLKATWILPIILACASFCLADLSDKYEWKYIEYDWESNEQKAEYIDSGIYDYTKITPNDVQPLADGRVLVTTPKYFDNPASLSTISENTGDGGPLLKPYPDWSWHTKDDCSGITSVNRVFLDKFDRLWLVDSGRIGTEKACEAKVLVFDATTDCLLKEFEIPSELAHTPGDESKGQLEIGAVETTEDPDKSWVYISDIIGYALLIWDGEDIWRLESTIFAAEEDHTNFSINGENVTLEIGPSSFLITPDGYLKEKALLFKAQSSITGHAASLEDLHNSKSGSNVTYYSTDFIAPSQELARAYSKNGGYFIAGFTTEMMLACWNLRYPLEAANIGFLVTSDTRLQYVSGVKITEAETLYVLSNKFQKFLLDTMDFGEVNFRVSTANATELVAGTVCEQGNYTVADGIQDKAFSLYEA